MAPELRKRTRSVAVAEKPAGKKTTKVEKVETIEPAAKKTKVEKKVVEKVEPAAKKTKAEKKVVEKVEKVEPAAKKTKVEKKVEKVEKVVKADKTEKTPKRKAAPEEASPIATKKQKAAKATPKSKKSAKAEPVKEAEPEAVEEDVVEEAETSVIPVEEGDSDDEIDADLQALAAGLDPEDAPAGDGTVFKTGQDVGKVPSFDKKLKKNGAKEEPGVVFISRLPHGFYEHELRGYFSQFGPIKRLRLARNKKTGASKHWAFIEFAEESTAEIVCKTMDSYLLFGHILKVKAVPRDSVHADLWKGANKRFKKIPWNKLAASKIAEKKTESDWTHKVSREEKKRLERAEKLKALGYDFEAPKLKEAVAPPPEPMAIDAPEETKAIEAAPEKEEPAPAAEEEEAVEEKPKATKSKAKKGGKAKKAKA